MATQQAHSRLTLENSMASLGTREMACAALKEGLHGALNKVSCGQLETRRSECVARKRLHSRLRSTETSGRFHDALLYTRIRPTNRAKSNIVLTTPLDRIASIDAKSRPSKDFICWKIKLTQRITIDDHLSTAALTPVRLVNAHCGASLENTPAP
jgi:hypothetical protein